MDLLRRMKEDGVPPTQVAFNTAIGACAFFGRPSKLSTGEFFFVSRLAAEAARAEAAVRIVWRVGVWGQKHFLCGPVRGFCVFVGCGVAHVWCFVLLLVETQEQKAFNFETANKSILRVAGLCRGGGAGGGGLVVVGLGLRLAPSCRSLNVAPLARMCCCCAAAPWRCCASDAGKKNSAK